MSEPTVVAVVTIVLIVLPLLWALSGWFSRRSSRAMLRGVGLALIPVGLVLTGLMRLLVRAIRLVVDWFAGTVMTTTIWIGIIVIAVGLVTWFVSGIMPPVDRETGRQRRQDHAARKQARGDSQTKGPRSTKTPDHNPTGNQVIMPRQPVRPRHKVPQKLSRPQPTRRWPRQGLLPARSPRSRLPIRTKTPNSRRSCASAGLSNPSFTDTPVPEFRTRSLPDIRLQATCR
ncbi:hypothetical protein HMPREF9947_0878 [Propionibacterium sp. 409-HC1]|nr:hypothetical protein HMPREF9947_0878 [Propionibacterium sp. 409-HC1]